ncbi:MAG: CRISPR-associated endonuclease Cas1 [Anaerolineae bacterium]
MTTLYVIEQGAQLHKESRRLCVRKDGRLFQEIPLFKVDQVVLFGNIGLTTPALKALLASSIDVVFLNQDGRYRGRLVGETPPHVALRMLQYQRAANPADVVRLARCIVAGKIENMYLSLQRWSRIRPEANISPALERLRAGLPAVSSASDVPALLGIEGSTSGQYMFALGQLLTNPDFSFCRRVRRPPTDPVNALLSFGYVILTRRMESVVQSVGLDPYLGFLHGVAYNRPSLALDLIEEFRSVIVDSVVLRCINNRLLTLEHFQDHPPAGGDDEDEAESPAPAGQAKDQPGTVQPIWLTEEGKTIFLRELERRFREEVQHPLTGERTTYLRVMELQAREMARCLREGDDYRPFVRR